MSERELRVEAVRRRLAGESPTEIAAVLGRTTRWVRKWVARHDEDGHDGQWAQSRSRAPLTSPTRTPAGLEAQILASRARLVANPRAQYGSLAIQWDLRRVGVELIPPARTIERVLERGGVAQPRRRRPEQYQPKNVPYPARIAPEPGTTHQIDMIGPRHLFGAAKIHTMNLIDVGSHRVGNDIITETRPRCWSRRYAGSGSVSASQRSPSSTTTPTSVAGSPRHGSTSPDRGRLIRLDVTARFIPLPEPWRNGVVEHFNDVWDKSFFRTEVFTDIDHLRPENSSFVEFHNTHHRYSAHAGSTPNQMWHNRLSPRLPIGYQPPNGCPPKAESKSSATSNRTVSSP